MKINSRYQTAADASQQLSNTTVVLDGKPCHITSVDGWTYVVKNVIPEKDGSYRWSSRTNTQDISNCDLELVPIELGYVNDPMNIACYLQRKPLRKWKQGLYAEYLRIKTSTKSNNNPLKRFGNQFGLDKVKNILKGKCFLDMYYGIYPSFYRAYTQVRFFNHQSVAFNHHWAFKSGEVVGKLRQQNHPEPPKGRDEPIKPPEMEVFLEYKGDIVGECEGANLRLYKKHEYLTETFIEAMIHAS